MKEQFIQLSERRVLQAEETAGTEGKAYLEPSAAGEVDTTGYLRDSRESDILDPGGHCKDAGFSSE